MARAIWHFSGDGLPAGQHVASLLVTAGGAYAGTMGAGVYASRDHGRHWAPLGRRLAGSAGIVLALAEHAGTLLAGTAEGIYRLDGQIPFRGSERHEHGRCRRAMGTAWASAFMRSSVAVSATFLTGGSGISAI
jgi:hypothetical protein